MSATGARAVRRFCGPGLILIVALSSEGGIASGRDLTASDAVATARVMIQASAINDANPQGVVSISPEGTRYVLRIVRGLPEKNVVEMTVLSGRMRSVAEAAAYEVVTRLETSGKGSEFGNIGAHRDTLDWHGEVHWIDEQQIALLWSNAAGIRQIIQIDLAAGATEWITASQMPIADFRIAAGKVLFFAQAIPPERRGPAADGYVVGPQMDAYSVFRNDWSGRDMLDRLWSTEWFIQDLHTAQVQKVEIAGRTVDPDVRHRMEIAPDGSQAVISTVAPSIPEHWTLYSERYMRGWISDARQGLRSLESRNVHQLFILNLATGTSRPLWDAPFRVSGQYAAWAPNGRKLLVAPTFLPTTGSDSEGLHGDAVAVVDVASGAYERIPLRLDSGGRISAVRWTGSGTIELDVRHGDRTERRRFQRRAGDWRPAHDDNSRKPPPALRIELRQDLNLPPRVWAVAPETPAEHMIIDPNHGLLEQFKLGRVEKVSGVAAADIKWEGLLIYPPGFVPGRRYPLVIQSVYGRRIGSEFTLYGDQPGTGTGPATIAPYGGQVFAARGMFVLHLTVSEGARFYSPQEAESRTIVFEAAVRQLSRAGLVDEGRVGLVGFSRNGWYVQYALTHSEFPFAAAISADNIDLSYTQETLVGYGAASEAVIGQPPFGSGLQAWLDQSPAFNADKVVTPLLMVEQSGGLFGVVLKWEMFSRLRYLQKPVEFYLAPDFEHGAHATQNPRQIVSIQQRCADWFDFWLRGNVDPDPVKSGQYLRWHELRRLQQVAAP